MEGKWWRKKVFLGNFLQSKESTIAVHSRHFLNSTPFHVHYKPESFPSTPFHVHYKPESFPSTPSPFFFFFFFFFFFSSSCSIPPNRVLPFGTRDNFWEMGEHVMINVEGFGSIYSVHKFPPLWQTSFIVVRIHCCVVGFVSTVYACKDSETCPPCSLNNPSLSTASIK